MIENKALTIILIIIITPLMALSLYNGVESIKWKDKFEEQNELRIELELDNQAYKSSSESSSKMLTEIKKDYENLSKWATNTYCEIMVGNAYISLKGNLYNRVTWKLYLDRELLTRPPMVVVDCRGN